MEKKRPIGKIRETALATIPRPQLPIQYVSADNRFGYLSNLKPTSTLSTQIASQLLVPSLFDVTQSASGETKGRERLLVSLTLSRTRDVPALLHNVVGHIRNNPSLFRDTGRDNNMFRGLAATITHEEDTALYQRFKKLITIAGQPEESEKLLRILNSSSFPTVVPFINQFKDTFEMQALSLQSNKEIVFPPYIQYVLITLINSLNFPVTIQNMALIKEADQIFQEIHAQFVSGDSFDPKHPEIVLRPSHELSYPPEELESIRVLANKLHMRHRAIKDIRIMEPTRFDQDIAVIDTALRLLKTTDRRMQDIELHAGDQNSSEKVDQLKIAQKNCSLAIDDTVKKLLEQQPNTYHYLVQRYGKKIVREPGIEKEQYVLPPNHAIEYMEPSEVLDLGKSD